MEPSNSSQIHDEELEALRHANEIMCRELSDIDRDIRDACNGALPENIIDWKPRGIRKIGELVVTLKAEALAIREQRDNLLDELDDLRMVVMRTVVARDADQECAPPDAGTPFILDPYAGIPARSPLLETIATKAVTVASQFALAEASKGATRYTATQKLACLLTAVTTGMTLGQFVTLAGRSREIAEAIGLERVPSPDTLRNFRRDTPKHYGPILGQATHALLAQLPCNCLHRLHSELGAYLTARRGRRRVA